MATPIRTKLKIVNPQVSDSPRTYLTADVDASPGSPTQLQILSKRGFFTEDRLDYPYYYTLVGDYAQEKTEIVEVDSDNLDNKILEIEELSNSHSAADPVTVLDYNQIKIYGDTLPGRDMTDMDLIATIYIDPTQSFTEYVYEYVAGPGVTQYTYFTTTFLNARRNDESVPSEQVEADTFVRRSIKRIIESAAIKALTRVEESPTSVLNWQNCIDIVQDGIDEIQNRKRNWPFWRTTSDASRTTIGSPSVLIPIDTNLIKFVRVDGEKIDYISELKYNQLTAYQNIPSDTGLPRYYTIKNGYLYFTPTPDKVYVVSIDYFYVPPTFTELSDTVALPVVPILIYYCASMFAYIRGNDKRGDKMYAMFTKLLEQQVDEYTGPEQGGDAEEIEATDTRLWEEEF